VAARGSTREQSTETSTTRRRIEMTVMTILESRRRSSARTRCWGADGVSTR